MFCIAQRFNSSISWLLFRMYGAFASGGNNPHTPCVDPSKIKYFKNDLWPYKHQTILFMTDIKNWLFHSLRGIFLFLFYHLLKSVWTFKHVLVIPLISQYTHIHVHTNIYVSFAHTRPYRYTHPHTNIHTYMLRHTDAHTYMHLCKLLRIPKNRKVYSVTKSSLGNL